MGEHGPVGEVELGWGSALSELVWVWYSISGCGVSVDWDGVCVCRSDEERHQML